MDLRYRLHTWKDDDYEDGGLLGCDDPDIGGLSSSETSVEIYYTTRSNIPQDSHLHTHRCEKLTSQDNNYACFSSPPSGLHMCMYVYIYKESDPATRWRCMG
jgi:hypothetical protein